MLSLPIRRLMGRDKLVTAAPRATVFEVAQLMREHGVGAIAVVEDGLLTGVFTERDAVFRVIAQGCDVHSVSVGEVMTPQPVTVDPEVTLGRAMVMMRERGCRHLPVLEDGKLIGMVSARDALDPEIEDFVCEERRRDAFS
jgi:CBS domain-containing protein